MSRLVGEAHSSASWSLGGVSLCLLSFMLVGCEQGPTGDVVPTVPAQGVLTYKGEPLEYHRVMFQAEGQRSASGITDAEGKFELGTNGEGDGAPVGTHRVLVRYIGPPDTSEGAGVMEFKPPPPPKVKIPAKYHSADTSGVTYEIPDDGDTEIVIDLK